MPVISTNTAANTAVSYLNINSTDQSESLAKLASGAHYQGVRRRGRSGDLDQDLVRRLRPGTGVHQRLARYFDPVDGRWRRSEHLRHPGAYEDAGLAVGFRYGDGHGTYLHRG